jgi:thioredoxin-dependent peroxiredoxin
MLEIGKAAPDFALENQDAKMRNLKDYAGKNLVLYFYPKDDTSGCTTEAKDFTELLAQFANKNTVIVGVSRDSAASHCKFIAKHELGVELLSDIDGKMCESYGVWVEKSMYGKKYMGIERSTYLIDESGVLQKIWNKVQVKGHANAVLESLAA